MELYRLASQYERQFGRHQGKNVQGDLLDQGLMLMGVGMGVVFAFLTALVAATSLMSRLVLRFEPASSVGEIPADEIAAISAAIAAHERKRD